MVETSRLILRMRSHIATAPCIPNNGKFCVINGKGNLSVGRLAKYGKRSTINDQPLTRSALK